MKKVFFLGLMAIFAAAAIAAAEPLQKGNYARQNDTIASLDLPRIAHNQQRPRAGTMTENQDYGCPELDDSCVPCDLYDPTCYTQGACNCKRVCNAGSYGCALGNAGCKVTAGSTCTDCTIDGQCF